MGTRDTRVDAYIAKSKDFAQPLERVLASYLRKAMNVNEDGIVAPERAKARLKAKKRELPIPAELEAALEVRELLRRVA